MICHANKTAVTLNKHTPAKLLRSEFERLGEVEIRDRALRISLDASGSASQVIDRLVNFVIAQELKLNNEQ